MLFQISELYTVVKKWEATADVLPKVVDRLSALKDLHEQGKLDSFAGYIGRKRKTQWYFIISKFLI